MRASGLAPGTARPQEGPCSLGSVKVAGFKSNVK
jgi:hypothetical protein